MESVGDNTALEDDLDQEECCICVSPLNGASPLTRTLPCGHRMHTCCLRPWEASGKSTCPTCRAPVLNPPYPEGEFPVLEITRRRYDFRSSTYYYKLRWKLSPRSAAEGVAECTWEPERNLENCKELLAEFEISHPRSAVRKSPRLAVDQTP